MITNIFSVIFVVLYFAAAIWLCRNFKFSIKAICVGAIGIAMTALLASILIPLPTGSAITCGSWLPLMLIALVYDFRLSIISGWLCGILAIFLLPGWTPVHWAQIFLEHLIAFSALGLTGVFGIESRGRIIAGAFLAFAVRFTAHVLSGVIFFSQNAWAGWGAWAYSLGYHISSKIPEFILCLAVLLALPLKRLSKYAKGGLRPWAL